MTLQDTIFTIFGSDKRITDKRMAGGGDINESFIVTLSDGERIFVKENRNVPSDFFAAEEAGLRALKGTDTIPTASVIASGKDGSVSFLILEYISSGRRSSRFFEDFGHNLAALHAADTSLFTPGGAFGFTMDNYIGATAQKNKVASSFIEFYRESRLEPQFKMAWSYFDDRYRAKADSLLSRLDSFLIEPAHPSLLHGDLWGGNYMTDQDGNAMLIDPAVYVGHPEADVAMTELFGGFDLRFYQAYKEAAPFAPGYADRRDLYNLYHLLNHLNLFGPSYLGSVTRILDRYC